MSAQQELLINVAETAIAIADNAGTGDFFDMHQERIRPMGGIAGIAVTLAQFLSAWEQENGGQAEAYAHTACNRFEMIELFVSAFFHWCATRGDLPTGPQTRWILDNMEGGKC